MKKTMIAAGLVIGGTVLSLVSFGVGSEVKDTYIVTGGQYVNGLRRFPERYEDAGTAISQAELYCELTTSASGVRSDECEAFRDVIAEIVRHGGDS